MDGRMDERTLVSISPTLEETKIATPKFLIVKKKIVAYEPQVLSKAEYQCKGVAR
jgi:hypothetical protein